MDSEIRPILYSLHNCPFAIRARLAIVKAQLQVRIRAIKLDNKPVEMLEASPKGTVPVLAFEDGKPAIEQSLDIMVWALRQSDPNNLLYSEDSYALERMLSTIESFEHDFDPALNAFGCAKRYHETNMLSLRKDCEVQLALLESRLSQHSFLFGEKESLVDIALVPFLRKFARIDKQWFRDAPYPKLRTWLNNYLQSPMFSKVMEKQELWLDHREDVIFGRYSFKK
ncbi:glutathione S-transferase [Vibrio sp. SCSIO 43140]|uniref:glutathione S-transferase n=1 Tax=Vibrio sp. SCSIO 43140 TaxID=2819100 RepID=UPI0020754668|nr:glutathione S-transferase [Vibrio sp. SCSIO 43140]USD61636.1 glutathione S-transferase [Vibrio sp. SCSIO 43140]